VEHLWTHSSEAQTSLTLLQVPLFCFKDLLSACTTHNASHNESLESSQLYYLLYVALFLSILSKFPIVSEWNLVPFYLFSF
jgi:hypothetical protein